MCVLEIFGNPQNEVESISVLGEETNPLPRVIVSSLFRQRNFFGYDTFDVRTKNDSVMGVTITVGPKQIMAKRLIESMRNQKQIRVEVRHVGWLCANS